MSRSPVAWGVGLEKKIHKLGKLMTEREGETEVT